MLECHDADLDHLFDVVADLRTGERTVWMADHLLDRPTVCRDLRSLVDSDQRFGDSALLDPCHAVAATTDAPRELRCGDQAGRYQVERVLGRGGMATVYLARQEHPSREVALKVLTAPCPDSNRLEREADFLARLDHPAIAHVYEVGQHAGRPFIAMEYIDGHPLDRAPAISTSRARLDALLAVCDGVAFAHRQGILHLDLKPDNILATADGRVRILDFGIARAIGERPGAAAGTRGFMAPEQARGDATDTRADVYALGVIGSQLLGESAFRGDLALVLKTARASHPDDRYQSVERFADDLRRAKTGRVISSRASEPLYVLHRTIERHRALAALAGAVALLTMGVAIALAVIAGQRDDASRQRAFTTNALRLALSDDAALADRIDRFVATSGGDAEFAFALHDIAGMIAGQVGLVDESARHHQRSLDLARAVYGESAEETLRQTDIRAADLLGRGDFGGALALIDRALGHVSAVDNSFGVALRRMRLELGRAVSLRCLGRLIESENVLRSLRVRQLDLLDRRPGLDTAPRSHPSFLAVERQLGLTLLELGRIREAIEILESAQARAEALPRDAMDDETRGRYRASLERAKSRRSADPPVRLVSQIK